MKARKGTVIISFENNSGIREKIDLKDGGTLFIAGKERPEDHANCLGVVLASGVDGIEKDDVIGVSYQATFHYTYNQYDQIEYPNSFWMDSKLYFVVEEDMIYFIRKGDDVGFKDWVLMTLCGEREVLGLKAPPQKGVAEFYSGDLPCARGSKVYFHESFSPSGRTKLYEDKYFVLKKSLIVSYEV